MIVVESLLDREALPWQADWYRSKVEEHLGDATDDRFRLWFVDNALHGDDEVQERPDPHRQLPRRAAPGAPRRERLGGGGRRPARARRYEVVDGQVVVPADARERRRRPAGGDAAVDGGDRADVAAGDEVTLRADGRGAAGHRRGSWPSSGTSTAPAPSPERDPSNRPRRVEVERRHSFAAPGTYFPTVRVAAQRDGDPDTPYARLQNLARARVVVS